MSAGKKIGKRSTTQRASKVKLTRVGHSRKSSARRKTTVDAAFKGGRKAASNASVAAVTAPASHGVRASSKLATVISMLQKSSGATIDALCTATGWQAHSVRGALSGALKKKLGLMVTSDKANGVRIYRIAD